MYEINPISPHQTISVNDMIARLAVKSCSAEPIVPDGWSVPNGYMLKGPRGNRKVVSVNHDGRVLEFDLMLWLAGIAYGDDRAARR
jgi:hypothetical protein